MRPERRCKSGMGGGLTAAPFVSPSLHLRIAVFLSDRWGPPQVVVSAAAPPCVVTAVKLVDFDRSCIDSLKVLFEPFEDRFHSFICPLPIHVEVYAAF